METIVVGAGQAGIATSHELAARGVDHLVLEAGRIGQTWRTRRWDSFRLVTPNWMNVLPGQTVTCDFDTDNPGQWMTHCHNVYHEQSGMMGVIGYIT